MIRDRFILPSAFARNANAAKSLKHATTYARHQATQVRPPEVLRKLKPASLLALLESHRSYLTSRNLTLPSAAESFDYDALSAVLASPNESSPPELVESLEMIDLLTKRSPR